MDAERKKIIEDFVRHTLGCRCPDEVFRSIVSGPGPEVGQIRIKERIVVGDKLLIHTVEADAHDGIEKALAQLCRAGLSDRDRNGLNRFRLVIGTSSPGTRRKMIEKEFEKAGFHDEKLHVHVVLNSELP